MSHANALRSLPLPGFLILIALCFGLLGTPSLPADETAGEDSAKTEKKAEDKEQQPKKKVETAEVKTPKRKKVRLASFRLSAELPESPGQSGPFGELQTDLWKTVERMEKAADDDEIAGAILRIEQPMVGRGRIYELRAAIDRFKEAGKKVYAVLELATPTDYMIASACDEIVIPESGAVILPGVHAESMFFKGMFDKIGVEADFMHIGAYKGAAEPFTRKDLSPEVKANLTSLIDDIYDQMLTTIADDRLLTVEQVRSAVDHGILTAAQAHDMGLIDRIEYPDNLREELRKDYKADPLVYVENYGKKEVDTDFSGPMGFVKLLQLMMGVNPSSSRGKGKKVAIVYAVGPIMTGKSESDPFGGSVMGSSTIVKALREADKDDKVAAIVLRINSPGGSAIASDLIWRETRRIKKPIVASMSDVAGSGGYYIAMGCDKIYAAPGTITGSIGVVTGKFAIDGMYDKLGITTDTIQRGKNSGMFGSSSKFTESERKAVRFFMEDIYGQFTAKAAEGRGMELDKLKGLAGGRVYTGRQAKRNGLIDGLGSMDDAIAEAKKLAGLGKDEKVRFKLLPKPVNFFESMFGDLDSEKEVDVSAGINRLSPELGRSLGQASLLQRLFREPAVLLTPYEVEVR